MKQWSITTLICFLLVPGALLAGTTVTVTVPSTAGPWDVALNPSFNYGAGGSTGPIVISSANGFSFVPGSLITVAYLSGTVSAGAGYPFRDANGDPNNVMNTCSSCPAFYMNPGVPAYGQALVGTFANNGVIVGQPFPIGNGPATLTVPAGANQLLMGINDNYFGDNMGSYTVSVSQPDQVCLLYDPTKAAQSGSTIPIKLQLCEVTGNNLSSSTIVVHAISVTKISDFISGPVESPGNANPDNDFRFDPNLGTGGGYIFNLSTKGLNTGSYNLNFTSTSGSFVYAAPFQVK